MSKLIVNRVSMQNAGIAENNIQFIQKKAHEYKGVYVFDKMHTSKRGYLASAPHFDLNDMIEAQKVFIGKIRYDAVPRNEEILKMLEDMRDGILQS